MRGEEERQGTSKISLVLPCIRVVFIGVLKYNFLFYIALFSIMSDLGI